MLFCRIPSSLLEVRELEPNVTMCARDGALCLDDVRSEVASRFAFPFVSLCVFLNEMGMESMELVGIQNAKNLVLDCMAVCNLTDF